jgi:putative membrane protein
MIHGYSDHAANERTFLAWVRTGIAIIAFGFVIEKFDLFLVTVAHLGRGQVASRLPLNHLEGTLGRYDGLAFIAVGVALIVLATLRFIRTTRLLDDEAVHAAKGVRAELVLSAALVVLVASYSIHLAFD